MNLFDSLEHDHHSHLLQFLPGLGPRKAFALLRELQQRAASNAEVESRQGLRELLGQCVWHNAVGFVKMAPPTRPGEAKLPPGLEGSRVHPESYEFARFMCFNAVADEDEEQTEEALEAAVSRAMWPDGIRSLFGLELDGEGGYAEHLKAFPP